MLAAILLNLPYPRPRPSDNERIYKPTGLIDRPKKKARKVVQEISLDEPQVIEELPKVEQKPTIAPIHLVSLNPYMPKQKVIEEDDEIMLLLSL